VQDAVVGVHSDEGGVGARDASHRILFVVPMLCTQRSGDDLRQTGSATLLAQAAHVVVDHWS
jgi:hypothetical protein